LGRVHHAVLNGPDDEVIGLFVPFAVGLVLMIGVKDGVNIREYSRIFLRFL
jgi:hypothetical protein